MGIFDTLISPIKVSTLKIRDAQREINAKKIAEREKAIKNLDKKIKITNSNQKTVSLLKFLWDVGAFNGVKKNGKEIDYNTAVDGQMGKLTLAAVKNALKFIYNSGGYKGIKNKEGKLLTYKEAVDGFSGPQTLQAMLNMQKRGWDIVDKGTRVLVTRNSGSKLKKNFAQRTVLNFLISLGIPPKQVESLDIPDRPYDRDGNLTKECAAYVNNLLKTKGIGSTGNSYSVNSQFKDYLNGYTSIKIKPNANNTQDILKYHKQAADIVKNRLNTSVMDPNNLYTANMYYTDRKGEGSRYTVDFYKLAVKGGHKQYATHEGLIYFNPKNKLWEITHNLNGKIYTAPLNSVLGGDKRIGITAIADAGRMQNISNILKSNTPGTLDNITVTAIDPRRAQRRSTIGGSFVKALNNNRKFFMDRYKLTDKLYALLSKFGEAISNVETKGGSSVKYDLLEAAPDWTKKLYKELINGETNPIISRGLTRIKYLSDIKDPELRKEYNELGINDQNLQTDPDAMAKATIARAYSIYKNLHSHSRNGYHWSDGSLIPEDVAMAMYWNRGRVTDFRNPNMEDPETAGASGYARRYNRQRNRVL